MSSSFRVAVFSQILGFLCLSLMPLGAGEPVLPLSADLSARLGWTPEEALAAKGTPANIFPFRGETPDEDNVVFYYSDHSYLFWFQDRVWQTRVDSRWRGNIDGVSMGMTLEEVVEIWQRPPINNTDTAPTWTLPDRGYPVRIRLFFDGDGTLFDIYVFRSDW